MSNAYVSKKLDKFDGVPCPYCLRPMVVNHTQDNPLRPTRDHIHPKDKGGQRRLIVCMECNGLKKNMTIAQFVIFLREMRRNYEEMRILNDTRIEALNYLIRMGLV